MCLMKSKIELYTIERVKALRIAKGLSVRYFADCLTVSHSFIQKIEDPDSITAYNLDHLNEIAKILDCTLWDIIPQKPFANDSL